MRYLLIEYKEQAPTGGGTKERDAGTAAGNGGTAQ
jgi:hypothetical protein